MNTEDVMMRILWGLVILYAILHWLAYGFDRHATRDK